MKQNSLLLTAFFTLLLAGVYAQNPNWCGLSMEDAHDIRQQMLQNEKEAAHFVRPRNAVTYVPVRFWLVAKTDGSERPLESGALEGLCKLNEAYKEHDIQFYLKEFEYWDNNTVWDDPSSNAGSFAIKNKLNISKYNAINVFVVNDAGEGAAAYWQGPAGPGGNDWIVVNDSYIEDVRVLPHEVGHFFALLHTFNGWECTGGFDPSQHPNPAGLNSPCGVKNEFVNGSNCSQAGDFLCDTPADYMFPTNNCDFNTSLQVKDANGDLLAPDLQNIMNYAFGCSEYYFSEDQVEVINNSLFSSSRNYVRPNYTPTLNEVTEEPTQIRPINGESIDTYNSVLFEWTAVPAADNYLLEIQPIGGGEKFQVIVNTNSVKLTNLVPNKTYFWKVMAYNEYSTCLGGKNLGNLNDEIFKTGNLISDTFEIPLLNEWTLVPNPVNGYGILQVIVDSNVPLNVNISLRTMTGQLVQYYPNELLGSGNSSFEMDLYGIPAGMYMVTLQTEDGLETKRVSVQ